MYLPTIKVHYGISTNDLLTQNLVVKTVAQGCHPWLACHRWHIATLSVAHEGSLETNQNRQTLQKRDMLITRLFEVCLIQKAILRLICTER